MLVIRFFRTGKKNQPSFKIVVTDKRKSSTTGRSVEEVGFWNPLTKEKVLKPERIKYWLSVGAKPSPTVFNLLVSEKIVEGKKIDVHKKPKEKEKKPRAEKPAEKKPAEDKPKEPAVAESVEGKEKKEEKPKDYNPPTTLSPEGRAPEPPKTP